MPFTPFHFGPGLMVKAIERKRFWLSSFVAANVLVDCEVLYYLSRGDAPIHRYLHSYMGGFAGGLLAGASMFAVAKVWNQHRPAWLPRMPRGNARSADDRSAKQSADRPLKATRGPLIASLVSGVIGGVSHVLLDSFMHHDMRPFWPFADGNGLLGMLDLGTLHIALAASGFFGLIFWLLLADPR